MVSLNLKLYRTQILKNVKNCEIINSEPVNLGCTEEFIYCTLEHYLLKNLFNLVVQKQEKQNQEL
jgi:hypothetical protein